MSSMVLVFNGGSSSLKYEVVDTVTGERPAGGIVERIGDHDGSITHRNGDTETTRVVEVADHGEAVHRVLDLFREAGPSLGDLAPVEVGHRVVMGGADFDRPVIVDDALVEAVDALSPLAPLHNPVNLAVLRTARRELADLRHVAVFDTAFFRDLPPAAATYALDRDVARRHGIKRYGYHGTSHQFVSRTAAEFTGRTDDPTLRQIVLHLGNGASASAVVGGRPVDTSMGLTPLEGLVMGSRSGDLDPAIAFHLHRNAGFDVDEIDRLFNQRSGMIGLTGERDMREVRRLIDAGDADARLGLDVYLHRLRHYIGAYAATMGGVDQLVFTAGVGENDAIVRAGAVESLGFLGMTVDADRNVSPARDVRVISPDGAAVTVLVVPTDEELSIARQTVEVLEPTS